MEDKLVIGTGQAHELAMALGRNGWTNADVKQVCQGSFLRKVLLVACGKAEIVLSKPIIDCDLLPLVPSMVYPWRVVEHRRGGQLEWDKNKVFLYLSEDQKKGLPAFGFNLHEELAGKRVLNARVLDFLLENPDFIPEEWSEKTILFWGTIYQDTLHRRYVRSLFFNNYRWAESFFCLTDEIRGLSGYQHTVMLHSDI